MLCSTGNQTRHLFSKYSPCLIICVLAKKRKEGMAQWKPLKKYKKLRFGKEQSNTND